MGKNTQISELINYISVDGSGNIVMTGNLIMPGGVQAATQTYVNTAISNLVNAAPAALDTLKELATALNNDASFATTVTTSLAGKLSLTGGTLTGGLTGTTGSFSGSITATSGIFNATSSGQNVQNYYSALSGTQEISYAVGKTGTAGNSGFLIWRNNGGTGYMALETYASSSPIYYNASAHYFNTAATFSSTLSATKGTFTDYSGAGSVLSVFNYVATNATAAVIRQIGAGGNGNQDIGLVVDIQGANDADRIANFRYYDGTTYSSRFIVTRGGSIGIGTIAPATTLHVLIPNVASTKTEIFRLTDGVTTDFKIYLNRGTDVNSSTSVVNTYAGNMSFETNNTERMRITNSGALNLSTNNAFGLNAGGYGWFGYPFETGGMSISMSSVTRTGGSYGMSFNSNNGFNFQNASGATNWITINSSGYLGVNVISPYSPFTVKGGAVSWGETVTYYPSTNGYITLAFRLEGTDTTTGTWAFGKESSFSAAANTPEYLQIAKMGLTGGALHRVDAAQSWHPNGNALFGFKVGIGTTNPSYRLSVAYDLQVGAQGGNDFTLIGGGSGVGSYIRNYYASGTINNEFRGNGDNYLNQVLGKTIAYGGVKFGSGSSTLNYYQEGSWTPQLYAGATAFTMTGINSGKYIRIGNMVTVSGHLQWSGGSGSGMVKIAGLPFASSGVRSAGSIGAVASGISFDSGYGMWLLVNDPGYDFIYIIELSTSGQGYSHTPPVQSSGTIYGFSLTYHIL